jgi:hypothetical protein
VFEEFPEDPAEKIALLGEPMAEFRVGGRWLIQKLIAAPLFILLGVAIDLGVFWWGKLHSFKLLVFGIFLAVGGVMIALRVFRSRGMRVVAFPEGLIRLHGRKVEAFFWDEIEEVCWNRIESHWARIWEGSKKLIVQRTTGRKVIFDDSLPKLETLGEIVQKQTLNHLLPQALKMFEAGDTLRYGKLGVDRHGLIHEKELLPWKELQEFQVGEDAIRIIKKGKWRAWQSLTKDRIPNCHVLQALVEHAVRQCRTTV